MTADALLAIIAGRETAALIEVRCRRPSDGRITAREWFPVNDRAACLRFIADKAPTLDVYIGVAPRTAREGGKAAIQRAWCLWADLDTSDALERLRLFRPRPTLIVASGTGKNVHAYWALSEPLPPAWVERANRRLAHHLGADMKATDSARILRPLGSLNHKQAPPARVTVTLCVPGFAAFESVRESMLIPVVRIVGHLPDPPTGRAPVRQPRADVHADDPLLGISADHYYGKLTGREILRGNVTCPFHNGGNERTPSMRLYETTWYCFGCGEGGSIYQFAAALWDVGTRGEDFKQLRERLTDVLR